MPLGRAFDKGPEKSVLQNRHDKASQIMLSGITHFVCLMEDHEIYHCEITAVKEDSLSNIVNEETKIACRDNLFELKSAEDRISKKIASYHIKLRPYHYLDPFDSR